MYVGIAMSLASAAAIVAQTVVKRLEKKRPTDSDVAIGLAVTAAGLATAAIPTPYTHFTGVAVSAAGQVVAWLSHPRRGNKRQQSRPSLRRTASGWVAGLAGPVDEGHLYKTLGPTPSFLEGAGLAALGLLLITGATKLTSPPPCPP